jgi:hypothetical protein
MGNISQEESVKLGFNTYVGVSSRNGQNRTITFIIESSYDFYHHKNISTMVGVSE